MRSSSSSASEVVVLAFAVLLVHHFIMMVGGQPTPNPVPGAQGSGMCDANHACYPWQVTKGPFCARGNLMPLRFFLDIAPEDNTMPWNHTVCGINTGPNTSHYALYAFCTPTDYLAAYNLSNSSTYAATYIRLSDGTRQLSELSNAFLRVFGLGTTSNIEFPQRDFSDGAAQVVGDCPQSGSGSAMSSGKAVVPFLVLNISMTNGKFQYYNDYPQPGGVGFAPSCQTTQGIDVCLFDASMVCIGPDGRKNCATCYTDATNVTDVNIQVWTSYYGTDRLGRSFLSGSNNPLNFRAFAGGTLWTSLQASVNNVRNGDFNNDPSNIPPGGVQSLS